MLLLLWSLLPQAEQDVPDFLEQAAEDATGTHYGPQGGQFASKDIRVSSMCTVCI